MAAVTDKIKSVVDFFVKGFEPKDEDFWDEMDEDMEGEEGYEVDRNLAVDPAYSYQPKQEPTNDLKVVNHPNYKGYEVMVMEPRSFDDAAQIVQHLKERKGNLEKEMKNVSKGRDEYNEQFHEMYGSMIDEYDLVQEETFQSATESGSPPMHEYKLDTAFENPDEFIKACELFRFYLYNESKKHIQPRYPFVCEKIEYAIGRYISDSDICGFSDTDKSVYIYMLLSQVEDILIEKMGVE